MSGDPTGGGVERPVRRAPQNLFFLGAVIIALSLLAVGFASYQSHQAYSTYCQASAHAGEEGCKAEKPFWEPVFADPLIFFAFATALFTGGLILVGTAQAGLFWWQLDLIRKGLTDTKKAAKAAKKQAKLARESLIASHRAWLKPSVSIVGNLTIDVETGAFANVAFELENIGNTVARDIRFYAWLLAPRTREAGFARSESAVTQHRMFCELTRKRQQGAGFLLYPGEIFPGAQGIEMYSTSAMMSAEDLARLSFANIQTGSKVIPLNLGGAVNYRFPSDNRVHQSSFLYELTYNGVTVAFELATRLVPEETLGLHGIAEGDGRQAD